MSKSEVSEIPAVMVGSVHMVYGLYKFMENYIIDKQKVEANKIKNWKNWQKRGIILC